MATITTTMLAGRGRARRPVGPAIARAVLVVALLALVLYPVLWPSVTAHRRSGPRGRAGNGATSSPMT